SDVPTTYRTAAPLVGTRSLSSGAHSRDPLALPTLRFPKSSVRRRDVVGEVDLEEAGIDLLGRVQIVDRNRGVVALRIGHRPLLELAVLDADHQHQPAGADQGLLLLDGDADVDVVGRDVDDI